MFSSSKETDTLRRTGLDAAMMEILQVLKHSLKQGQRERRGTVAHHAAGVESVGSQTAAYLYHDESEHSAELLHTGKLDDLVRLLNTSAECNNNVP